MATYFGLDTATISVVFVTGSLTLSVFLVVLQAMMPRFRGIIRWAAGDALVGVGFLLLAHPFDLDPFISIVLADTAIVAGVACVGTGTWAFLEKDQKYSILGWIPPAVIFPLLAYFTYVRPWPAARNLIVSGFLSIQFVASAVVLLSRFPYERKAAARFTAGTYLVTAVTNFALFGYASEWGNAGVRRASPILTFLLLAMIASCLAWTFGLVLMAATRLVEELATHERESGRRERDRLVKTIIDALPQYIGYKDLNSRYLACNEAFARSVGKEPRGIVGLRDDDLYPAELAEEYRANDRKVIESGRTIEMVERGEINGKPLWIETVKGPVRAADGSIEGVLFTFKDVTGRKREQEALMESEKRFRELSAELERRVELRTKELLDAKRDIDIFFDLTGEFLCVLDSAGRILKTNPSWTRELGWRADELAGKKLAEFVHEDDRAPTERIADILRERTGMADFQNRVRRADGEYLWFSWSSVAIPDRNLVIGVAHDITSRVATMETLKAAREEAERASRSKSQFISTMSHELRTPLNAVLGYCALLEGSVSDERGRLFLKSIGSAGRALLTIINDLLDLTKAESGRIELTPAPFDPRVLLQELSQIFRFAAEEKALDLEFHSTERLPKTVLLDAARLRQVLVNLVGNALKFTDRGSVSVLMDAVSEQEGEVPQDPLKSWKATILITVADTGIGMTEEYRRRLFEPFTQQDSIIERKYGGTGLGLAIAKRLLDLMGAGIRCDSEPNRGTRFDISIPSTTVAGNSPETIVFLGSGFLPAAAADDTRRTFSLLEQKDARLHELSSRLDRLSSMDELTSLANRKTISARLERALSQARKRGERVSVLLGDLDGLKRINELNGDQAGDLAIAESARRFAVALRPSDAAGRWAGEEFLAVLPRTDLEEALAVADTVRKAIEAEPILISSKLVRATISIGVASLKVEDIDEPRLLYDLLVRSAENALYRAKAKGRNRVEGVETNRS